MSLIKRTKKISSQNYSTIDFSFDWNKTIIVCGYRSFLRFGKEYNLTINHTKININPIEKKCTFLITIEDNNDDNNEIIKSINNVYNFYNIIKEGVEQQKTYLKTTENNLLTANIVKTSSFYDSNGNNIKNDDLNTCDIVGDIHLVFYLREDKNIDKNTIKYYLVVRVKKLIIIEGDNKEIDYKTINLPSLDDFKSLTIKEMMEYYPRGKICDKLHNSLLDYTLYINPDDKKSYIVNREYYIQNPNLTGFVHPNDKKHYCQEGIDIDNINHHYAVVLTYKDKRVYFSNKIKDEIKEIYMKKVLNYCKVRKLEVKGIWYDEGTTCIRKNQYNEEEVKVGRIHCNLHLTSILPLQYFRVLFEHWRKTVGSLSINFIYEPLGWRMYGSRNHFLYYIDNDDNVRPVDDKQRFYQLIQHIGYRDTILICLNLPSHIIIKKLYYKLYDLPNDS
jgi:hypothetical protein